MKRMIKALSLLLGLVFLTGRTAGWDVYGTGNPFHNGYIEDWLWYVGKIDGTWTVLDFGENDTGRPYAASTDFVP